MSLIKKCGKCEIEKYLSEFYFRNNTRKHCSICKVCEKENAKKWQNKNRDKVLKNNKKWARDNIDKKRDCDKKYAAQNKSKKAKYDKEYREKNKERLKEKDRLKYIKNKEKISLRAKKYRKRNKERLYTKQKEYRKNNIQYRISTNLRNRLNKMVKRNQKAGSAVRDLGCSVAELKDYLELKFQDGMRWENYGEWHIDHIKPLVSFDLTDCEQFLEACHYTNLQPLWAKDNLSKGAKI